MYQTVFSFKCCHIYVMYACIYWGKGVKTLHLAVCLLRVPVPIHFVLLNKTFCPMYCLLLFHVIIFVWLTYRSWNAPMRVPATPVVFTVDLRMTESHGFNFFNFQFSDWNSHAWTYCTLKFYKHFENGTFFVNFFVRGLFSLSPCITLLTAKIKSFYGLLSAFLVINLDILTLHMS